VLHDHLHPSKICLEETRQKLLLINILLQNSRLVAKRAEETTESTQSDQVIV
jgi:hypothetical protein